jgi:low affinity Fe/Cu permease
MRAKHCACELVMSPESKRVTFTTGRNDMLVLLLIDVLVKQWRQSMTLFDAVSQLDLITSVSPILHRR